MGKRKNEASGADTDGKKAKLRHASNEDRLAAATGSTPMGEPGAHIGEQTLNEVAAEASSVALPPLTVGDAADNNGADTKHDQDDAHSSINDAPQPDSEEKTTPTNILDLPGEILLAILYLLVGTGRDFGIQVDFKARNVFRSVCRTWCAYIDGESKFWTDVYIKGSRIPAEDEYFLRSELPGDINTRDREWKKMYDAQREKLRQEACDKAEVPIAELSIARSQNRDINLILLDPTYRLYSGTLGLDPFCVVPYSAREGVLELINSSLKERKVTSLSIVSRNVGFVRQLLDPRLDHELKHPFYWERGLFERMTNEQLVRICFSKDPDPAVSRLPPSTSMSSETGKEERDAMSARMTRMDEERDALAKDLHTLRIFEPPYAGECQTHWNSDWQRCILPSGKYPALRRVEIKTFQHLQLFALPYPQLTHLKLETEAKEEILLGIIKGCVALEFLAIVLPEEEGDIPGPISMVQTRVAELHITLNGFENTGKVFINRLQTPNLSSLQIDSDVDCSGPVKELMQRSTCRSTHFHLNLNYFRRTTAENLRETLEMVSNSLERFTIMGRLKDEAWLEGFKPGLRMKSMTLDLGYSRPLFGMKNDPRTVVEICKFFMYALSWTADWMEQASELERANRNFAFVSRNRRGSPDTWGAGDFSGQQESEEMCSLVNRIKAPKASVQCLPSSVVQDPSPLNPLTTLL
ncbi:hypothetical protein D9611_013830 [Ephemerocybe angulata]|uniref:F-box domain-containing protein n=1 Tax=Ephemerocybe angulata TaxID=980116 RepID=A0A8H5C3R1_9AGAR|nr:hypothetical protein D9611_013830 [Tulosesus angulatus]